MNCSHRYTKKQLSGDSLRKERCPYSKLYLELRDNSKFQNLELPIDNLGECLFHSNDEDWKLENHFQEKFKELFEILSCSEKKTFDFSEFVFVGTDKKFVLEDINDQDRSLDFTGALFKCSTEIKNIKIYRIVFEKTFFEERLRIDHCLFLASFSFENSVVDDEFFFTNITVEQNSYISDSKFMQLARFHNVVFNGCFFLKKTTFSFKAENLCQYEEPFVRFDSVTFNHAVNFEKTIFDCSIEFPDSIFNGTTEFPDTQFSKTFVTCFSNIKVNSLMSFISSTPNKIFPSTVAFLISEEDIKGEIYFENVNFMNIYEKHREILKKLSLTDKVTIGNGCIKYLLQTEVKEFTGPNFKQVLVLEFTETFKNFFLSEEGVNLGVEIVYRDRETIKFFYFTDQNIPEDEFYKKLGRVEEEMWKLLTSKNLELDSDLKAGDEKDTILSNEKDRVLINPKKGRLSHEKRIGRFDTLLNLMSLMWKVGIRKDQFDSSDMGNLINAVGFSEKLPFNVKVINQNITNNYTQKSLLSLNSEQNIELDHSSNNIINKND